MVAVVGGHAGQTPRLRPLVPFVQVHLRVVALGGEQFVGEQTDGGFEFGQLFGIGEHESERDERGQVLFGVPVAVVNLQPRQAVQWVVLPLFDVRQEDHSVAGGDGLDELRDRLFHLVHDGSLGIDQEPANFRTGHEQHTVLHPPPTTVDEIARWAIMVRKQDATDPGLLRVGQHFGQCSTGVSRVFGVRMQDAAIVNEAGQRRNADPLAFQLLNILVNGFQPGQRQTFQVGERTRRRLVGTADRRIRQ